ncbi:MAG: hypothetical protein QM315_09035 [Bacillota bacterium]|jgi:hypothetical protein|nr:hypothetical protein [Bacillota bacterium]
MKKKWTKHLKIFLCAFAICAIAANGAWRIWFDPYRGTVSAFRRSEKLDTLISDPEKLWGSPAAPVADHRRVDTL